MTVSNFIIKVQSKKTLWSRLSFWWVNISVSWIVFLFIWGMYKILWVHATDLSLSIQKNGVSSSTIRLYFLTGAVMSLVFLAAMIIITIRKRKFKAENLFLIPFILPGGPMVMIVSALYSNFHSLWYNFGCNLIMITGLLLAALTLLTEITESAITKIKK